MPGRPASAQPSPQLVMPYNFHEPPSGLHTSGPLESPCNQRRSHDSSSHGKTNTTRAHISNPNPKATLTNPQINFAHISPGSCHSSVSLITTTTYLKVRFHRHHRCLRLDHCTCMSSLSLQWPLAIWSTEVKITLLH